MLTEIGAGIGGAVTLGAGMAMFKFLNAKIDKKQDKVMCERIAQSLEKAIDKSEEKHKETMTILRALELSTGKIEQKILNNRDA